MARLLTRQGWLVVGRNARHIGYELDLVACKGSTMIVVEVKARKRRFPGGIPPLMPPRKRAALRRGAAAFLATWRGVAPATIRIDLAVVYGQVDGKSEIDYFVNVLEE